MEAGSPQSLRDRAALIACQSGNENRSIVCHKYPYLVPSDMPG
jgi:hypothetical protein